MRRSETHRWMALGARVEALLRRRNDFRARLERLVASEAAKWGGPKEKSLDPELAVKSKVSFPSRRARGSEALNL